MGWAARVLASGPCFAAESHVTLHKPFLSLSISRTLETKWEAAVGVPWGPTGHGCALPTASAGRVRQTTG